MVSRPVPVRTRVAVLVVIAALPAAGCGGRSKGGADEVKALVAREVEAMNARDLKALGDIWSQTDDILLFDVAPPGRLEGWPAIARSFSDLFGRTSDIHMITDNVRVLSGESLASATYDWTLTGKMGEATLEDRGQATEIFRHEKDGWKLVHAHYSAAPPAAAGAGGAAAGAGGAAAGAASDAGHGKPAAPPEAAGAAKAPPVRK